MNNDHLDFLSYATISSNIIIMFLNLLSVKTFKEEIMTNINGRANV